jgi:hypothetical protein
MSTLLEKNALSLIVHFGQELCAGIFCGGTETSEYFFLRKGVYGESGVPLKGATKVIE